MKRLYLLLVVFLLIIPTHVLALEHNYRIVNTFYIVNIVWIITTLVYLIYNYLKHDREPQTAFKEKYFRDFPDNYGPEVVEYLMKGDVSPLSLSATILSIISKKGFNLSNEKNKYGETRYVLIADKTTSNDNLTETELFVKAWFIKAFGYGGDNFEEKLEIKKKGYIDDPDDTIKIDLENIKNVYKDDGEARAFYSKYEDWSLRASVNGAKEDFFEKNTKPKVIGAIIFAIGLVINIIGMLLNIADSMLLLSYAIAFILYVSFEFIKIGNLSSKINRIITFIIACFYAYFMCIYFGIRPTSISISSALILLMMNIPNIFSRISAIPINTINILSLAVSTLNILLIIYVATFKKRTIKGNDHYKKWMAFERSLLDFGRFSEKELPEVALWEKYLVYATVFGIAHKVNKQMKMQILDANIEGAQDLNINYLNYVYFNFDFVHSIEDIVSKGMGVRDSSDSNSKSSPKIGSSGGFSGGSNFGGGLHGGSGGFGGGGGRG